LAGSNHINSTILIYWFGGFCSFWTGFGGQRLKKYSNLADSNRFNFSILIYWSGDFDSFWTGFGCERFEYFFKLWQPKPVQKESKSPNQKVTIEMI